MAGELIGKGKKLHRGWVFKVRISLIGADPAERYFEVLKKRHRGYWLMKAMSFAFRCDNPEGGSKSQGFPQ